MPGLDDANHFSAGHDIAHVEGRQHRLVARDHVARMFDRQHIAVDDES
jgi:hypothetical protein